MQTAVTITELDRAGFLANLDAQLAIYAAAMAADPADMPGRQVIMERHSGNPDLRSLVAIDEPSKQIVGFGYGFHGSRGQWWHDVVWSAVTAADGPSTAHDWLDDAVEVAELHVQPDFQGRGIGRRLLLMLTAGRPERTAVLSTRDADTPARRLYHSLGFTDLLRSYVFPGGGPPYAVMGAPLPLPGGEPD